MIRRWMLGLVVGLLVIIIASGNFASTGGIDVEPSNAGYQTITVDIELPVDPCAGEVPEDITTDEPNNDQSPDRAMLGEREESDPESGEPTESCEAGEGEGEGKGDKQEIEDIGR